MGNSLSMRIANLLDRWNLAILLVGLALAVVCWPLARDLRLDWQLDRMFAPGDSLVASYHRLENRFGGNQIVLAVYRDPQLWDASGIGLDRLTSVSDQLAQVDGVAAVLSLAELHRVLAKLRVPQSIMSLGNSKPALLNSQDELAQAFLDVFAGYTHQRDSKFVAIACLLNSDDTASDHRATISALRKVIDNLPSPAANGLVTGEPVMVTDGFELVERDGLRLGITSTCLLTAVLLFSFHSLRWTVIPLLVVHWSLIVTKAILVVLDLELTMVSSMLTAIVTVIGVATTMHLLLKYQDQRRRGSDRRTALREALTALVLPIAWACVTDAVGFIALMAADVGPVRDFGLMMAIGSLTVLVAILLLVPGLALIGKWDPDPHIPKIDFAVRLTLRKLLDVVLAHRKVGLTLLVVFTAVGLFGGWRMHVETDFTKNFYASSPLVQGYQVVERELGGAGVWDIMLPAPLSITSEYLDEVLELERQLAALRVSHAGSQYGLTKVLSIADADRAARVEPLLSKFSVEVRLQGMRQMMPEFTQALLTWAPDDYQVRWLRVMLRSKEQTTASVKSELITAVTKTVNDFTARQQWREFFEHKSAESFSKRPPDAEVTGYHVMLSRLVASVLADQWKCFVLATLGIFLVMLLATRSLHFALAALVPNAFPIIIVLGAMGICGMHINMGAAMIAAVSMGLSVDSSIHYLLHYQRRLHDGDRPLKALRSAQENVGFAVVLATIALIAGFLALAISEFIPTVVFGALTSLTMLGGLAGNLVILPLLIAPRAK